MQIEQSEKNNNLFIFADGTDREECKFVCLQINSNKKNIYYKKMEDAQKTHTHKRFVYCIFSFQLYGLKCAKILLGVYKSSKVLDYY